jgi:hypothetical protein
MVTRPDSAADRVNAIFARRHALTNRARVSGPATPPATTQLHQLTLAGNGNANASTSNVSIISSPATTITVSPRSSASLESFGEGETEVDGEDLTGGTFVSTSTSASASAEEAETPDEDECAAADASADTIRTQRATRASNTGTIKAKNGQSPGALLEMLVNENGGLFKENEKLRAQLVTLRSEALIVERAKREKARQERADAIGIPKLHAASKLQHKPQELHAVVPPPKLLSALPSPPQVQITPAPGKKRTVEELQKKLERRREKHEVSPFLRFYVGGMSGRFSANSPGFFPFLAFVADMLHLLCRSLAVNLPGQNSNGLRRTMPAPSSLPVSSNNAYLLMSVGSPSSLWKRRMGNCKNGMKNSSNSCLQ